MNKTTPQLVFLCGARDFHAMDWYKSAKELLPNRKVCILTDLIGGEGYKILVDNNDIVYKLFIIDKFLFTKQSKLGHLWRNFIKLLIFPLQVFLLKRFAKKYPESVYHAHSMYYLFLAWAAGITYVGTPQGSDILIKPFKSKRYKYFATKSLRAAKAITVDSKMMKNKISEFSGVNAHIIQNGIDLSEIYNYQKEDKYAHDERKIILSIRGITPLYQIKEIVSARNFSKHNENTPLTFIYPFFDEEYMKEVLRCTQPIDRFLGRVDRSKMYELLFQSKLVISIPYSDSSPRSVYESIFCGCVVAATYHPYYDDLPQCMKERMIIIDINDDQWLDNAIDKAEKTISNPFIPTEDVLDMFDQRRSFIKVNDLLFSRI